LYLCGYKTENIEIIMVYTVYIDDTTVAGKKFMREYRNVRNGIEFQNPAVTGIIPEGYMTGDEFERQVILGLEKRLKENGHL
jgi:hypothetical protein